MNNDLITLARSPFFNKFYDDAQTPQILARSPFFNKFCDDAMAQTPQIYDELAELGPLPEINNTINTLTDLAFRDRINACSIGGKLQGDIHSSPVKSEEKPKPKPEFKFPERDGYCPYCGMKLNLKSGKFGNFYSCSGFPKCRYKCSIKQFDAAVNSWKKKQELFKKCGCKDEEDEEDEELDDSSEKEYTFSDNVLGCESCEFYQGFSTGPYDSICKVDSFTRSGEQCDMFVSKNRNERLECINFLKNKLKKKRI